MDAHPAVPLTFQVVTTFADRHWASHARRCVDSFGEYWGRIPLTIYTDAQLEAMSPWLSQFKRRHASLPTHNYRFDAVRFAHKVAAIELAFAKCQADYLIWMDADCVTHAPVDRDWLTSLANGADFAYLDRDKKYSEMGFAFIRINGRGAKLVADLVRLYREDGLFELAEWHDSFAFDYVRQSLERRDALRCQSLSGAGRSSGHPLVNGPLGERLDHLKGGRKSEGRSRKSDLIRPRTEAHWNG